MENQHSGHITYFEKFTWTINNFSKLNVRTLYSETFFIGGNSWQILIYPKGNTDNRNKYLSIFLDTANIPSLPKDWTRFTNFTLTVVNQVKRHRTITNAYEQQFSAWSPSWGHNNFMPLSELHKRGFIAADGTCVIEVLIAVKKPERVKLVDFKSFGNIREAYIPLLEEVCSRHPSLIECQLNRSRLFTTWAFAALGRVLYFLETTRAKNMNLVACSHLRLLWEELETCKFDLTWLRPHVQSALCMESYIEKSEQLKTMKEKVAALEEDLDAKLGYY